VDLGLNGVSAPPEVMRSSGIASIFEEADAQLKENWQKWLAWTNLQEIGDQTYLSVTSESSETAREV
jgi:hypothetical protein